MPKEKTVPVTSQVVRELSKAIFKAFNQNIQPYAEPCMAKVDALIQSHIDQVVAPLRKALEKIERWEMPSTGVKWDDGSEMSFYAVNGTEGERDYIKSVARATLSAQPIPGAKAEDTASAEFLKKALDDAIRIGGLSVSPAYPNKIVTRRGWRTQKDHPELAEQILIRTKEQP